MKKYLKLHFTSALAYREVLHVEALPATYKFVILSLLILRETETPSQAPEVLWASALIPSCCGAVGPGRAGEGGTHEGREVVARAAGGAGGMRGPWRGGAEGRPGSSHAQRKVERGDGRAGRHRGRVGACGCQGLSRAPGPPALGGRPRRRGSQGGVGGMGGRAPGRGGRAQEGPTARLESSDRGGGHPRTLVTPPRPRGSTQN